MALNKNKIYTIIFEHDTKAGKAFDLWLIIFLFISIVAVMLESVNSLKLKFDSIFMAVEWFFTALFTVELMLRLYCIDKKAKYIFSFYGMVDIVSIIPTYLAVFIPGAQSFLIFRALRMLRIFRILKLNQYTQAGTNLRSALVASRPKIVVFLGFITTVILIVGALMYLIESPESGFTSIPKSIYWAIVTMTTVGYGDITPQTPLGQMLSSVLMIVGYGVIAVPTGIVSAEITRVELSGSCNECGHSVNEHNANFCPNCGIGLSSTNK